MAAGRTTAAAFLWVFLPRLIVTSRLFLPILLVVSVFLHNVVDATIYIPEAVQEKQRQQRSEAGDVDDKSKIPTFHERTLAKLRKWLSCRGLKRTGVHGNSLPRSEFIKALFDGYDPKIAPNFDDDEPTVVHCDILLTSFDSISAASMDYSVSLFLRQRWQDERLQYQHLRNYSDNAITLDARFANRIWVPDLFFTNEKKAHFHDITIPNRFVRIYRNGTIYYSARLSLTLSCSMLLHTFPLDVQICSMSMESYAYTTDKLIFAWAPGESVRLADDMELPQFQLDKTDIRQGDCTKTYTTGNFTCLKVDFVLERDIGYYLIQTYIPSALIVILSWVSFWINYDAVPARISLGVLTILTMTTQSSNSKDSLPRVSYVKAIDVWMSTCLIFVFASLLEFAIVNVLCRKELRQQNLMYWEALHKLDNDDEKQAKFPKQPFVPNPNYVFKAAKVDNLSRIIFPILFFAFIIIYWFLYVFWPGRKDV